MTAAEPEPAAPGVVHLRLADGPAVRLTHDPALAASVERIAVTDAQLQGVWGDHLWRLRLTAKAPVTQGRWEMVVGNEE
jgi:hypothetical protein